VNQDERKLWAIPVTVGGVIAFFLTIAALAAVLIWVL